MDGGERFNDAIKAIKAGNVADLQRLLDHGVDPNFMGHRQQIRLLTFLLRNGVNRPVAELMALSQVLLGAGADANLRNGEGHPPIHYATSFEVFDLLVENGAQVDDEAAEHLAKRWRGRKPMVDRLLAEGLDFAWKDSLRQVYTRCQYFDSDGLSLVEILDDATPFVSQQVITSRECLAGNTEVEYFWPLEKLYAVNRINDLLINGLIPEAQTSDWPFESVSPSDYVRILTGFGFTAAKPRIDFVPFFHEVVTVDQDPDDDFVPVVVGEFWPAMLLDIGGPATNNEPATMVFSRAGVRVRAGKNHIEKTTAETSKLYWANRRANRDCVDLSHGWGSNSQWGTDLRIDIVTETHYRFNTNRFNEDSIDLAIDDEGNRKKLSEQQISRERATELLMNRCFVTPHPDNEPWVYDYLFDLARAPQH